MELPNVFDNEKRYIFTNWLDTDFTCSWDGVATTVKSGESIELPEYKAFHFTKHLVNSQIESGSVDSPEFRKPYEEKTIVEITAGVDSLAMANLKAKIKEEVMKEETMKSGDVSVEVEEKATNEFAELKEEKKKK